MPQTERLPEDGAIETGSRQAYIGGLRELAAFLDAHPDLPIPASGGAHNVFVSDKAALAVIARVGVRWEKSATDDYFYLRVAFSGGHYYDVNVSREAVCRKVVTGTRIEPAVPEREVEEFHWVCDEPLLAASR